MKRLLTIVLSLLFSVIMFAQEINMNVDIYSRYYWRGLTLSDTPALQPSMALTVGSFQAGFWGSTYLSTDSISLREVDFWIQYTIPVNGHMFTLRVQDYYFMGTSKGWSNWSNFEDESGPGSHLIEAQLHYNWAFFDFQWATMFWNDPEYTMYFEAGAEIGTASIGSLRIFAGFTPGSKYNYYYTYGTEDFAFTNVGFTMQKNFYKSVAFSSTLAWNPSLDVFNFIFGFHF